MKHNAPYFWHHALAYLLIGGGTLTIILDLLLEEKSKAIGLFIIWSGVFVLTSIKRKGNQVQDNESDDRADDTP